MMNEVNHTNNVKMMLWYSLTPADAAEHMKMTHNIMMRTKTNEHLQTQSREN